MKDISDKFKPGEPGSGVLVEYIGEEGVEATMEFTTTIGGDCKLEVDGDCILEVGDVKKYDDIKIDTCQITRRFELNEKTGLIKVIKG